MAIFTRARETVASAARSVADAMKVAILACVLSVISIIIGFSALARTRNA